MKHIATVALTCTFAAVLAAQQDASRRPKDPAVEIARAIAVEEQEGNLATAEQLYRKAREDRSLSEAARTLATTRLVQLLQRLGRVDEAKVLLRDLKGEVVSLDDITPGQVDEREKELRAKAREIIRAMKLSDAAKSSAGNLLPDEAAVQLAWIGEAVVPEVVAALQNRAQFGELNGKFQDVPVLQVGLLGLLWRIGGEQADDYLVACLGDGDMAMSCAMASGLAGQLDGTRRPVRALLDHESEPIVRAAFARGFECDLESLVAAAERGRDFLRTLTLERCTNRQPATEVVPRLHALVRHGLDSTDPDLGNAAEQFLRTPSSQMEPEGLRLLLRTLPSLASRRFDPSQLPRNPSAEELVALVPAIDDCVKRLSILLKGDESSRWLRGLMIRVIKAGGDEVVARALSWWDAGFDMTDAMQGLVDEGNAQAVFARRSKSRSGSGFFNLLWFDGALPRSMFDQLVAVGKEKDCPLTRRQLGSLLVRTGDARAVEWLRSEWRDETNSPSNGNTSNVDWIADGLLQFAKRDRSEPVRDALDDMLHGRGGAMCFGEYRTQIVMALLAMQDDRGLAAFGAEADVVANTFTRHPFDADRQSKMRSAMVYLFDPEAEPAHGLTEDQTFAALQRFYAPERVHGVSPAVVEPFWLSDRTLVLLAERDIGDYNGRTWQAETVRQVAIRLETGREAPLLLQWLERTLAARQGRPRVLQALRDEPEVVARFEPQLQAVLAGADERWAVETAKLLWYEGRRLDLAAQLQSPFADVRGFVIGILTDGSATLPIDSVLPLANDPIPWVRGQVARYCGARVAKEAVPKLISLLRDAHDEVRSNASEALTRIRFYHEQQAHWDRVLQGMDASPGSACEKLLLQAKPDQPKAQRLLAIQSLGTLGVPEALPFLIEWTTGADAEITAAAKAAITAIHLSPRK